MLVGYPQAPLDDVRSEQLWLLQEINGRAAVITAQRDFHVMHDFDALQIVVGALPFGDGSLILYGNRTYTEQVAGFASGAAHKIGRGMLISEVEKLATAVVAKMAAQAEK